MKKKGIFLCLRTIEIIIAVVLAVLVFFGDFDVQIGLTLNEYITWVPFTLLCALLVLVLVEFFQYKPIIRLTYLLITLIICLLTVIEDVSQLNAACWLMGLFYVPFLLVEYINVIVHKKKIKVDDNKTTTLPIAIYSKKQYVINTIAGYSLIGILIITVILAIVAFKREAKTITYVLVGFFPLSFFPLIFQVSMSNPFRIMVFKMNKNASYEDFEHDLNEILKENLHPESINNLNIIKSFFLIAKNKQASIELFNEVSIPTDKTLTLQYEIVEINKCFNEGNFEKASELISAFETKYPKLKDMESLKEQIRLQDANIKNDNVENIFTLNDTFKFKNIANADILLKYYLARKNMGKAKYYADFILSLNTDLDEYNNDARAVINKMSKK